MCRTVRFLATLVSAAITIVCLALATACTGGESSATNTNTPPPTATATARQAATIPAATPTAGAGTCPLASPRNDELRELKLALADPICVVFPEAKPGTILTAELSGQPSRTFPLAAAQAVFELPKDTSLYGQNGCQRDVEATLRLTVTRPDGSGPLTGLLQCSARTDSAACNSASTLPDVLLASTPEGATCVVLKGSSNARTAFRVEMTYTIIGTVFAYLVPPNETYLLLPDDAAPKLGESLQRCSERKVLTITVWEIIAGIGESPAGSNSRQAECAIP